MTSIFRDRLPLRGARKSLQTVVRRNLSKPQLEDDMSNMFQPVMEIRVRGTLPVPGSSTDAMLEGAKRNRALVVAMNKLGYRDVTVNVSMRSKRVPEPIELPALPGQDQIEDAIAAAAQEVADGGAAAMARKLAR